MRALGGDTPAAGTWNRRKTMANIVVRTQDWFESLSPKTQRNIKVAGLVAGVAAVGAVSGGVAYAVAGSQALFVTAGPVTLATGKAAIEMAKKFKA